MTVNRIARAAGIIMAGSVLSRVLGLGREGVISHLFGEGSQTAAYTAASQISTIVYDLLISGMVSAALVPVLSEYAADKDRAEFGRIVSIILTGAIMVLVVGVAGLELLAQPIVSLIIANKTSAQTRDLAVSMTQIVSPGVLFLGISAVLMSALYALQRFSFPALAMSALNAALIGAALILTGLFDVQSLAVGMLVGAVLMVVIQWPGLRDVPIRPAFDFRHPAVRRILRLYAPIAISLLFSQAVLLIDRRFAFDISDAAVSAMRFSTTLIQFALGIVGAAISLAALPSLSQHFAKRDEAAYRHTLGVGLRMVTVLVVPAAAGLIVLALPLITLVFQHGKFGASDTLLTAAALFCYVLGLPAAALNQVLIFGFYSRKNTVTPVIVGIVGGGVYLVLAVLLKGPLGMVGLVLANSAQLTFNAVVTGMLLWRSLGGLRGESLGATALKSGLGAVLMGGVSFLAWGLLAHGLPDTLVGRVLALAVPGGIGLGVYGAVLAVLRVRELDFIRDRLARRLPGRRVADSGQEIAIDDEAAALGAQNPAGSLDTHLVDVGSRGE